jgi:CTP:molybdopterin cytidylyltransferase MocA
MSVAAIILAAGASRRLGQPKQLIIFQGEFLLVRAIRLARQAGASPVLVVLGANSADISSSMSFDSEILIFNDQWEQGIATSIRAGLNAVSEKAIDAQGVLLMTCDQPRLTAEHLRILIEEFAKHPGPVVVASTYAGIQGIPAVFPRSAFADLAKLRGDQGARKLLAHPACPVLAFKFIGGEIDIDIPSDLLHLL